jgi:type II secretory pathway component PulF
MTTYKFEAIAADRRLVHGEVCAASEASAEQAVRKLGHRRILSVKAGNSVFQMRQVWVALNKQKIRDRDVMDFSYELAQLLGSGITLMKALDYILEATRNKSLKMMLEGIIQSIQNGTSFSTAIGEYKNVFSETYIQVIRASEKSGNLERGLTHLGDNISKNVEVRKTLKRVLTYPAIVLTAAAGVCTFLVIFVIPQLSTVFDSMQAQMPFLTRMMISFSAFLSGNAVTLFAILLLLALAFWLFRRTERGRKTIDKVLLRIPIIKGVILTSATLSYSHMCAMLLKSGLQLPQAMHYATRTVSSDSLQDIFRLARTRLLQGQTLTTAIKETNLFNRLAIEKLSIGERTGDIVSAFEFIANTNEKSLAEQRNAFVAIIEPVLTVGIGCLVALIALSTILPMYSLAGQIK